MTTIQSTILAFSTTNSSQASKKSAEGDFDALLAMNAKKDCKPDESQGATNAESLLSSIQQFIFNIDQSLFGIGDTDSSTAAANIAGGGISVDELLNQGGPLPAFLDRVATQYNLDDAHKQALRNIAIQFKDTGGSAAEISQMASALQAAGIG